MLAVGFNKQDVPGLFGIAPDGNIVQEGGLDMRWTIYDKKQSYPLSTYGHLNLEASNHFSKGLNESPPPYPLSSNIIQTNYNSSEQLFWLRKNDSIIVVKSNGAIIYQYALTNEVLGEMPILYQGTTT